MDLLHEFERMRTRSDTARRGRKTQNDQNWDAYRGEQDWSHKAAFQSREVTPGFPVAVDMIVGTFERALTDSSDWLIAEPAGYGKPLLEPGIIQGTLQHYMERLWQPGNHPETGYGIQVLVADSVKRGILEPDIVAKVFPVFVKRRHYRFKKSEPKQETGDFRANEFLGEDFDPVDVETMRIAIEVIPWDDYFPDPSPACRYEIHRTRRQLHELLANPDYDQEVVRTLIGRANAEMVRRNRALSRGERAVSPDPFDVEVYEGWGDIINYDTGELEHENVFWTWCEGAVLRQPTPNPFWDGTRPFITAPILRVPGSKESKALADHAVPMWRATNEMLNLILDGGMRAAWGIGQVRPDIMESPEEVAEGVPQGYTAVLKPNVPLNAKFYERMDNGEAPQLSLESLDRLERYVNEALATPDTRLGQLPSRQTKATEIVQAMQSSGSLFESFAARYEDTFLEPLLEKCWKIILQYSDTFYQDELLQVIGARNLLRLESMTASERFRLLNKTTFKVRGLRGLAGKEREFNKLMTLANLLASNQQFADHFGETYDYSKLWERIIRASGNDPDMLKSDDAEAVEETGIPELDVGVGGEEEGTIAGGQLDASLGASSGASAPNLSNAPSTPEGAQGGGSAMAASTNPNTGNVGLG